ncbi:MAG: hypothetical protein Q7S78_00305 [Candidatus Azambacteria bacterium]|nr:hypothetical protein [Candidatus Azambacteria bacterium]
MKAYKNVCFLAVLGLFLGVFLFYAPGVLAVENVSTTPAGFHQFNDLEIFKSPSVDEPPTVIEAIQKNEKTTENNNYLIQIEERTTLLGVNQEPALLSDFQAGEKINVSGWLSADSKTIRAAVIRNLSVKDYHQSFSGTIKKIADDGFTLTLTNGSEVVVKTPLVKGSQITIKGVFDKATGAISNVLSILVKPIIILQEKPAEETASQSAATPSAKPSTLFKNFLKVFGL